MLTFRDVVDHAGAVTDMLVSPHDHVMVRSLIDLAQSLGLRVVAEGVEDAETFDELARLGADQAQGFYIAHPMTFDDATVWVRDHEGISPAPTVAPS